MILHIPHSGTDTLDRNIRRHDILRGTDWFTDELFWHRSAERVVQKHSIFIVDCERLPDDIEELLKDGYGISYTKDFDGNDIVVPDKEAMIKIYNDHHKELNALFRRYLCYFPVLFCVDCHSYGDAQIVSDVDFCLGHNADFNNFEMLEKMKNLLESEGYKVGINNPYSNAIVPNQFYGNDNVKSIMIEVNKRLYLDNQNTEAFCKSKDFDKTQNVITSLLEIIYQEEDSYN
ncbi:N-formylglutamate amidohydrolase [Psychromonas sp. CNPT3]|uniref:N-formylglutamate amidohydrolase n=1 Tax=Psychromonas sp. CNPT3 TaxID=314282 RepID=UPI0002C094B8|nr:N-formylglutamate amidohydrolase [Psychromonas sp. CNPT3]AGH81528.1 N-formylglutamate amidohydrolase [Psychromonas sp. CNPT3]